MMWCRMKETKHYHCIERGSGSLKYYTYYFIGGRPLKSKADVKKALDLGVQLYRKDKVLDRIEKFDYEKNSFEVMTEWVMIFRETQKNHINTYG